MLIEAMAVAPPICARIRATRERLQENARKNGGPKAAGEFSQEAVARRVGITLKSYRAFETFREPNYSRRQQIARALGYHEDYFETNAEGLSEEQVRQIFRDELAQYRQGEEDGQQQVLTALAEMQKRLELEIRHRRRQ